MNLLQQLAELNALNEDDLATPSVDPPKKQVGTTDFLKTLTNNRTKDFNHRDAMNMIQKQHDAAEEVDTVAFGLELNDGEIVKVYVNAEQADDFEKAMADMLGQEDDVEEAIDKMSQDFDIVSVEWPEDRQEDGSPEEGDGSEVPQDIIPGEGDEHEEDETSQVQHKVKLNFKLNEPKKDKEEGDEEGGGNDKEGEDDNSDDIGDFDGDLGGSEGETEDDEEEDSKDAEGDDKKGKKKKKKAKKGEEVKESRMTPGQRVKARFLAELGSMPEVSIKPKGSEKDHQGSHIEKDKEPTDDKKKEPSPKKDKELTVDEVFRTPMQRKVFKLLMHLDFPTQRAVQYKQDLRSGIRTVSIELLQNSKARILLNKLLTELDAVFDVEELKTRENRVISAHKTSDLTEAEAQEALNKQLDLMIKLFVALGVPEQAVTERETSLRQNIRIKAKELLKHSKIQTYLHGFAKAIGAIKEKKLDEEVNFGNAKYLKIVARLLAELGVPDENLEYQRSVVINSIRAKARTLDIGLLQPQLLRILKIIQQDQKEQTNEGIMVESSVEMKDKAARLGRWSIAKLNNRVSLTIENVSFELNSSETTRLTSALEEGSSVTVKAGNKHYNFRAVEDGKEYVVFPVDGDEHENGILFPKSAVNTLLDYF